MTGWTVRAQFTAADGTTVTRERQFTRRPSVQMFPAVGGCSRALADDGERTWIVARADWIERIPPADPP